MIMNKKYFDTRDWDIKKYKNVNFQKILECLAREYEFYNMMGQMCKGKVYVLIIDECQQSLNLLVSKKQLKRLSKIRKWFPCNANAILMAVYNLLKRKCDNEKIEEIEELLAYIKRTGQINQSYQEYCFKEDLLAKIYNNTSYMDNAKYRGIYEKYISAYEALKVRFENASFYQICSNDFKQEEFRQKDLE